MSTTQNKETYISINYAAVKNHLREWQEGLTQLEKDIEDVKKESQAKYYEQIGILRLQLQDLHTQLEGLSGEMPKVPDYDPVKFRKDIFVFNSVFQETSRRIKDEEHVALGWLQGFTDARTQESEGWVEGMGTRPSGSEGWAEGMGKQSDGSAGWAEGYNNEN